jgi:hypothetical protein
MLKELRRSLATLLIGMALSLTPKTDTETLRWFAKWPFVGKDSTHDR